MKPRLEQSLASARSHHTDTGQGKLITSSLFSGCPRLEYLCLGNCLSLCFINRRFLYCQTSVCVWLRSAGGIQEKELAENIAWSEQPTVKDLDPKQDCFIVTYSKALKNSSGLLIHSGNNIIIFRRTWYFCLSTLCWKLAIVFWLEQKCIENGTEPRQYRDAMSVSEVYMLYYMESYHTPAGPGKNFLQKYFYP